MGIPLERKKRSDGPETSAGPVDPATLTSVVNSLCSSGNGLTQLRLGTEDCHIMPSRDALIEIVESLRSVLFPGYFGASEFSHESVPFHVGATLDRALRSMQEQIKKALSFVCEEEPQSCTECEERAREITQAFLTRLPHVRRLLAADVQAAYEGDPAAISAEEVVICYPAILATTNYRLAHELYRLDVPLLPRIITEHAHGITGIDIHPGAKIAERFFIDHGTGVVIGETCVIGKRVRVYQGVTLGAKSFPLDENGNPIKGIRRHPIVEDDVIIYGGATILGRVTIGRGSIIGGNVWLTESVPPRSRITQARAVYDHQFSEGAGI
jgi:serine O-acetyltransferase